MNKKKNPFLENMGLYDSSLWEKLKSKEINKKCIISFDLEITARCNNNCRHCYICLPGDDKDAEEKEMSLKQIKNIAKEAVRGGAIWCLITGGEPLLRKDFFEIYLVLKKMGLLVSVFTNATLIDQEHINLFKQYPPREIEVTVYGVRRETYEKITRVPGSFSAFAKGVNLLLANRISVRFKAMALRSNICEMPEIARFCREKTIDFFRFDPFLHLRFDGDPARNKEIKSERLSAEEIVTVEKGDVQRYRVLEKSCDKLIFPEPKDSRAGCNHLFHCGTGRNKFVVSYDGYFRLCSSLWHPECIYDLKTGSLSDAMENFVPRVRNMRSNNEAFLKRCRRCRIINLCMWCAAHAHLETGKLDMPVEYFCQVAYARAKALEESKKLAEY